MSPLLTPQPVICTVVTRFFTPGFHSTIHTMCFFGQFLFNHMLQYSTTHTYVYTQRYRHRIAASFSPKTKFDGSIDFSVTAQLRPPSGENPAVFGW